MGNVDVFFISGCLFLVLQDVFCGMVRLTADRRPEESGGWKASFSAVIALPGRLLWLCL